jgi:hypothetical protein
MSNRKFSRSARLSLCLSFVVAAGVAGCGSSSSNGSGGSNGALGGSNGAAGGSNGAAGGTHGSGGAGPAGTGGAGGATASGCGDVPPCLANLLTNCMPSGTCIEQQSDPTNFTMVTDNFCYSNGVKQSSVTTIDLASSSVSSVTTFSKAGSTCFSEEGTFGGAGGGTGSINVKNGAGSVVAVLSANAAGDTTVTCGGQTYVIRDMGACAMPGNGGASGADCTMGSCP